MPRVVIGPRWPIVSVVAGGWSIADLAQRVPDWWDRLPGRTIGVNESGLLVPRCAAVVSMDRLWTEARWDGLRARGDLTWLRRNAVLNIDIANARFPWLTVFDCDHSTGEFAAERHRLNGPNSGHCALNLAWQAGAASVYLFGFDMCRGPNGESHWHGSYAWRPGGATSIVRFREWSAAMEQAAGAFERDGVRVLNCSTRSVIPFWPKVDPMEVINVQDD